MKFRDSPKDFPQQTSSLGKLKRGFLSRETGFKIDRRFHCPDKVKMTRMNFNRHKPAAGLIFLMIFLGMLSLCSADQIITVAGKTFTLVDTNKLVTKSAVKKAKANSDAAIAAAAAAATNAENNVIAIEAKHEPYDKLVDAFQKNNLIFYNMEKSYADKIRLHNDNVNLYTQQLKDHNDRVAASNALKPENRNDATIKDLNAEYDKLGNWKTNLASEMAEFDKINDDLSSRTADLKLQRKLIKEESNRLSADIKSRQVEMGEAYRQLQICYKYALQINTLLKKYKLPLSPQNDAQMSDYAKSLEQIQGLKREGFDGNTNAIDLPPQVINPPVPVMPKQ